MLVEDHKLTVISFVVTQRICILTFTYADMRSYTYISTNMSFFFNKVYEHVELGLYANHLIYFLFFHKYQNLSIDTILSTVDV